MILQFFRRKPPLAIDAAPAQTPADTSPTFLETAPEHLRIRAIGAIGLAAIEKELVPVKPPPIDPMAWLNSFPLEERLYRRRRLKAELGMLRFGRAPARAPGIEWRMAA